ncbi:MAG: LLM class flavin-dependent oxidoreductase [Acidimicrobiales bacterium]|nr:LLM class flavin-dependent oxidoreductase [Acidimicrobiales bacterium]MYH74562.1 LLM class flavin-dependent oxidoreductase [Acidimicrobiales bacterium]MYK71921.1 LLM class flavin-dependent oxidoreductase [Acidimicrobiales bacterium]
MTSGNGLRFGWLSPCIGNRWSDHRPIVADQVEWLLPEVIGHFDSLWIADHFYGFDAKTDPFLEAWTTITWCAARLPDVQLCHHVLGHGYRPPALTAKMAATLQYLSGNRFILGIGAGWRGDEYEAYGYEFPSPKVRFAQLEEVVTICRLMWTRDDPSFEGQHYRIDGATAPPLPEVPPPICIGASGEQIGLKVAARHADIWNTPWRRDLEALRRKCGIVLDELERLGRDPAGLEMSTTVERALPTTDSESAEYAEFLASLVDVGIRHFVLDFGNPGSAEPAHRFAEQVISPLRASSS